MPSHLLIITQTVDTDDQLLGFFVPWLNEFARQFDTVTVLCLQRGTYDLPKNVIVRSLGKDAGLSKYRWLWNFYVSCWKLRREYDAVFVHMNPIWVVLGGPLWWVLHKRVVLWYTHKAVTFKLWLAEKMADRIATASPESFRLPSKKVVVTGHGIDTELFRPDSPQRPANDMLRILSVGRIAPVKHYEVLVDAARILHDDGVKFSVTVVGEPALAGDRTYAERLRRRINELGLQDHFLFVGKVANRDLPPYYRSHSMFVHMSETGSLDKTLLEAMACGMTVVSCNDAARSFLPAARMFSCNDAADLAAKLQYPDAAEFNGRQYVIDHHGLNRLIGILSSLL